MSPPIDRLLIANRGEIVVRIARTAHRLGMGTVGIYSEPDRNAMHTDFVDLALALGGVSASDSYLRGDAIIEAALSSGCDGVHPGYGFLAENAGFAQAVLDAGLVWVGPTPQQIESLGNKISAKALAIEAGVPTSRAVRVTSESLPTDLVLPVLVKAAAGGGGRGMRIVRSADELAAAIESAEREAKSAFGDGSLFVEPFIEGGRHIEVQIVGDAHGNVVHLGERECSIQRRNQKIVEEAPSAGIDLATRDTLCASAVALARHVDYQSVGTVEFLVGQDGVINFLEVNTRLQVEHPVTEAVTGVDLVELQLLVAAGVPLPIEQADVHVAGHAIEVRLVAEEPAAGWLPSTGTIQVFEIGQGVRCDSGVRAGSVITSEYDSLIAKVIAHEPARYTAANVLGRALRNTIVAGVETNLACLEAILVEPDFSKARTPTSYLDDHPEVLSATGPSGDDRIALLLAAVFAQEYANRRNDAVTSFTPSGWRNLRTQGQRQTWIVGNGQDELQQVEYTMHGSDAARVLLGPWPEPTDDGSLTFDERRELSVRMLARSTGQQVLEIDGRRYRIATMTEYPAGEAVHASGSAGALSFRPVPRFVDHGTMQQEGGPVSPLPGTVIAVHVAVGQSVTEGAVLMVVEAMKMEHQITASTAATVTEVRYGVGDRVDTGDLLVALDETGE